MPCRRRSHVDSRACDSSGSVPASWAAPGAAPGAGLTSRSSRSTRPGSSSSPARCAGMTIARRSSSSFMGVTSTWPVWSTSASPGWRSARP
ncbi:hypothetical protein LUX32_02485 [Actinomadura madurae]|nr:hypothetical protein [Actinomadura madurae]MCP9976679.1 hypothetical protein [Actinomadura madurae]